MGETIQEAIDYAIASFATLDPEIAEAVITMGITLSFVALPLVILVFSVIRSIIVKITSDVLTARWKYWCNLNNALASRIIFVPEEHEDTDTQPLYIIEEVAEEKTKV